MHENILYIPNYFSIVVPFNFWHLYFWSFWHNEELYYKAILISFSSLNMQKIVSFYSFFFNDNHYEIWGKKQFPLVFVPDIVNWHRTDIPRVSTSSWTTEKSVLLRFSFRKDFGSIGFRQWAKCIWAKNSRQISCSVSIQSARSGCCLFLTWGELNTCSSPSLPVWRRCHIGSSGSSRGTLLTSGLQLWKLSLNSQSWQKSLCLILLDFLINISFTALNLFLLKIPVIIYISFTNQ